MTDPLSVGLVCPYAIDHHGGVQNHVLGLARQLVGDGHRVAVLAPGGVPAGLPDGVTLTTAGSAVPVPYNGSVARVNFGPRSAVRVEGWLRRGGFDLVHVHEPITPSIALHALSAARVPVVATFHTATPRSRTMQLAGHVLAGLVSKIDAGIAVSESARQVVVQHLGRDAVVVPNGFDPTPYAAAAQHRPPGPWRGGARPRITFLGRTDEPRKGLQVLLDAVASVRRAYPEADVVVAGSGRRAVPSNVRNLGPISDQEKQQLFARTDVFVAPHLARESFGIVLLEALAAGATVVAAALPAFVDLLDAVGSPRSRVVPVGDPAGLASGIIDALTAGPGSGQGLAPLGDLTPFTWSAVGPQVEHVYRTALGVGPQVVGAAAGRARAVQRARQTWSELDAALVGRASSVLDFSGGPHGTGPDGRGRQSTAAYAGPLAVGAADALQPDLSVAERERVESDLSELLRQAGLDRRAEHWRPAIARRLHNDAVAAALRVGGRVEAGGLRSFEMAGC